MINPWGIGLTSSTNSIYTLYLPYAYRDWIGSDITLLYDYFNLYVNQFWEDSLFHEVRYPGICFKNQQIEIVGTNDQNQFNQYRIKYFYYAVGTV